MPNRPRWFWAALLVGALGLAAAIQLRPAANAAKASSPPGLRACATTPAIGPGVAPVPGAFFRVLPHLDEAGTLIGQRLYVGAGGQTVASTELTAESSVGGPVGGVLAVVTDDGRRSTVRLVSAVLGCATVSHETTSVVRRAIVNPADGSVLLHLLDRATRSDLGTWRLVPGSGTASRVVAPLPTVLGLGKVWATDLRLDHDGRELAVQSCLDRACLTRIVDLANVSAAPLVIRGPRQGPILGFAGDRLVTWEACDGYPCAVLAWDAVAIQPSELLPGATAAGLTADGRLLVAIASDAAGEHPVVIQLASGEVRPLRGLAAGDRPIAVGGIAATGFEVGPESLAMAQPAGDPHAVRPSAAGEVLP